MGNRIRAEEMIRDLRMRHGISRRELAERIDVSESHINKIEARSRRPGIDTLEKVLETFQADIVLRSRPETIKDECLQKIYSVIEDASDREAIVITNTVVFTIVIKKILHLWLKWDLKHSV